jgi:hypothetical protein
VLEDGTLDNDRFNKEINISNNSIDDGYEEDISRENHVKLDSRRIEEESLEIEKRIHQLRQKAVRNSKRTSKKVVPNHQMNNFEESIDKENNSFYNISGQKMKNSFNFLYHNILTDCKESMD